MQTSPTHPSSPRTSSPFTRTTRLTPTSLLQGQGTPLQAWQASRRLAQVPSINCAQLLAQGKRAVIIAPHPDDEILGSGGLLQLLNQHHYPLLLISVTNGSSSYLGGAHSTCQRLGIIRSQESAEALGRLGLPLNTLKWIHAGFPDAEVAQHEQELENFLLAYLQPGDVVFTTWRDDGHEDHEAVARASLHACAAIGAQCHELPIWAWHWAAPEDPRIPWQRARKLHLSREVQARKRHAVQAFASQLYPDSGSDCEPKLSPPILQRLQQPFELIFL